MSTWLREVQGHDGTTLELGYADGAGYFAGIYRPGDPDDERLGLTLWELVSVTRHYMDWSAHKPLFRVLQAAPVLLKAQADPTDPTARIVKQLCA